MKKNKLSKLAIVASGAMLLAGCHKNYDDAALKEYQRQAIQAKLEQLPKVQADAYIRMNMDGVTSQTYTLEVQRTTRASDLKQFIKVSGKAGNKESYLDLWAKNDTNGTFIDEYVDYAMNFDEIESITKAVAKAEFEGKNMPKITKADKKKQQLQQKIQTMQKQLDELEELSK